MSKQNGYTPVQRVPKMLHNGNLEVLEVGTKEDTDKPPSRPSSSSKRAPPIPGSRHSSSPMNGRSSISAVEKSLISVKRIEPQGATSADATYSPLSDSDGDDIIAMASLDIGSGLTGKASKSKSEKAANSNSPSTSAVPAGRQASASATTKAPAVNSGDKSSGSDESSDDEDSEHRKAPNQLIMEFLQCMMANDIENGLKLCKMILLYEPDNSKALKFLPLLQQKKEQDDAAANAADESGSDESGETDDSDEESDDDSDSDSSDSSEDEDDEKAKEVNTTAVTSDPDKSAT